jgi:uncharacterized membrane protein YhiD involved in acid resistance
LNNLTWDHALPAAAGVLVATVLSILVALVYRATHRGVHYSASFAVTLVMLSTVAALVMMVIGDSLARAFGVFGALSLVRFRTAVKDPRDIAFVFLSLAIGMAAGTGAHVIALAGSLTILLVVGVLSAMRFGSRIRDDHLLRVLYRGQTAGDAVQSALRQHAKRIVLLTLQSFDDKEGIEASWLVSLKSDPTQAVAAIQAIEAVEDVHLTTTREEIEP